MSRDQVRHITVVARGTIVGGGEGFDLRWQQLRGIELACRAGSLKKGHGLAGRDGLVRERDERGDAEAAGGKQQVLRLPVDRIAAAEGAEERERLAGLAGREPSCASAAHVVEYGELPLAAVVAEAVEAHRSRKERVVTIGAMDHEEASGRCSFRHGWAREPHEKGVFVDFFLRQDFGSFELHSGDCGGERRRLETPRGSSVSSMSLCTAAGLASRVRSRVVWGVSTWRLRYSRSGWTVKLVSPLTSAEMAAAAVSIEVRQGMRFSAAARRISKPSRSVSVTRPSGVLITASTMPSWMTSMTFGWPSSMRFGMCSPRSPRPVIRPALPAVASRR